MKIEKERLPPSDSDFDGGHGAECECWALRLIDGESTMGATLMREGTTGPWDFEPVDPRFAPGIGRSIEGATIDDACDALLRALEGAAGSNGHARG
jgi:hypothetical protein